MEVDQAVCSGSDCPHPPSLWGAALPLGRGRGGESALQSKMGAASRHHPLAAGAGWARVIGARDAALWSLPVVLYPVSPSSLPWYPLQREFLLLNPHPYCGKLLAGML